MNELAINIIKEVREKGIQFLDKSIKNMIDCNLTGESHSTEAKDLNQHIRNIVVDQLSHDYSINDIDLIRYLANEEFKATKLSLKHNVLSKVCAMLFTLGQLEDVFIIYKSKYQCRCMDAGCMIDSEMLKMRHSKESLIEYIKKSDSTVVDSDELIAAIIKTFENPLYESDNSYLEFITRYYGMNNLN